MTYCKPMADQNIFQPQSYRHPRDYDDCALLGVVYLPYKYSTYLHTAFFSLRDDR